MAPSKRPKPKPDKEGKRGEGAPKRAKKAAKRNLRGRRGALQNLPDMPMDIIFEVFRHLHPLDLLHLARTNKNFRQLLMSRSSAIFWKTARQNVPGLPDPMPGMSEPAFASLCFESHCNGCFKPGQRDIYWTLRMRLCSKCRSELTIPSEKLPTCEPFNKSLNLKPISDSYRWYLVTDIEKIQREWNALSTDTERDKFIQEKTRMIEQMKKRAKEGDKWEYKKKRSRSQELETLKSERFEAIAERLAALGYEEDVTYSEEHAEIGRQGVRYLPAVAQSKPLTERIWQNISAHIIEYIETQITPRRLGYEYRSFLEPRLQTLLEVVKPYTRQSARIFPRLGDLALYHKVRELLDDPDRGEITEQSFDPILPILPTFVAHWRTNIKNRVEAYLRRTISDIPDDVEAIDLAIAQIFYCKRCHWLIIGSCELLAAHRCMSHRCNYICWFAPHTALKGDDLYTAALGDLADKRPFSVKEIDVLWETTQEVVEACGLDPLRTTAHDLDALDPKLVCTKGCEKEGIQVILGWREAVLHIRHVHDRDELAPYSLHGLADFFDGTEESGIWQVLSEEDERKAEPLRQKAIMRIHQENTDARIWFCSICDMEDTTLEEIKVHDRQTHPSPVLQFHADPLLYKTLIPPVYLVPNKYKTKVKGLSKKVQEALRLGEATFEFAI